MKNLTVKNWLAGLVLILLAFVFFPAAGGDDAHILYWPAHTLTEFGTMVNYGGRYLEQASSLGFVLLTGSLSMFLPFSMVTVGHLLSLGGGALACYQVYGVAEETDWVTPFYASMALGTFLPFVYWSGSGMESTLAAVFVLGFLRSFDRVSEGALWRTWLIHGGWTLGFLLVRPEAFFVILCFLLAVLFLDGLLQGIGGETFFTWQAARILACLCCLVVIFGGIVAFRVYYFGAIFPQPVYAKTGGSVVANFLEGLKYSNGALMRVSTFAPYMLTLVGSFLVFLKILDDREVDVRVRAALMLWVWLAFVIVTGGDWMDLDRFFVPVMPIIVLFTVQVIEFLPAKRLVLTALLVLGSLQLIDGYYYVAVSEDSPSYPLWKLTDEKFRSSLEEYSPFEVLKTYYQADIRLQDDLREAVGELSDHLGRRILVLSHQGGFTPYHLGRSQFGNFTWVDKYGLVSAHFSSCRAKQLFGVRRIGIDVRWLDYLKNKRWFNQNCIGKSPDLVYASIRTLGDPERLFGRFGFVVLEKVPVETDITIEGRTRAASLDRVLAVDRDLFESLPRRLRQFLLSEGGQDKP